MKWEAAPSTANIASGTATQQANMVIPRRGDGHSDEAPATPHGALSAERLAAGSSYPAGNR